MSINTSNSQQEANFLEDDDAGSNEEVNTPIIPESHEQDTGIHHNSPPDCQNQPQVELRHHPRRRRTRNGNTT